MAAGTPQMALFKNGIEIPNTRFTSSIIPTGVIIIANYFTEFTGHATITYNPGDVITLRVVTNGLNLNSGINGALIASMNVNRVA